MIFKIVYWGVGLCGKTSNLQYVWRRTPPELRTEITSLATETGRMMSFSIVSRTLAEREGRRLEDVPFVVQYNKRDLPNAMPIEDLDRALGRHGAPAFEAVASRGEGVFDTLKGCARIVHERASAKRT